MNRNGSSQCRLSQFKREPREQPTRSTASSTGKREKDDGGRREGTRLGSFDRRLVERPLVCFQTKLLCELIDFSGLTTRNGGHNTPKCMPASELAVGSVP